MQQMYSKQAYFNNFVIQSIMNEKSFMYTDSLIMQVQQCTLALKDWISN